MHIAPWNNDVPCQKTNKQASPLRTKTTLEDTELFTWFIIVLSFNHPGWEQKKSQSGIFLKNKGNNNKQI